MTFLRQGRGLLSLLTKQGPQTRTQTAGPTRSPLRRSNIPSLLSASLPFSRSPSLFTLSLLGCSVPSLPAANTLPSGSRHLSLSLDRPLPYSYTLCWVVPFHPPLKFPSLFSASLPFARSPPSLFTLSLCWIGPFRPFPPYIKFPSLFSTSLPFPLYLPSLFTLSAGLARSLPLPLS